MIDNKIVRFFYKYDIAYFKNGDSYVLTATTINGETIKSVLKSEAELYAYMFGYAAAIGEVL